MNNKRKKNRMNVLIMIIVIVVVDVLLIGYNTIQKNKKSSMVSTTPTALVIQNPIDNQSFHK
jgi:hypothetical protein